MGRLTTNDAHVKGVTVERSPLCTQKNRSDIAQVLT